MNPFYRAGLSSGRLSRVSGLVDAYKAAQNIRIDGAVGGGLDWQITSRVPALEEEEGSQNKLSPPPQPEPPVVCCLYPWPDPDGDVGGPFYPYADLPATILYEGISMAVSGFDYSYFGTGFPPSGSGSTTRTVEGMTGDEWLIRDGLGNILEEHGICLVSGTIQDEFPDTYTVTFDIYTWTITRVSLCVWETEIFSLDCVGSTPLDPIKIRVEYAPDFKWIMTVATFFDPDCQIDVVLKDDPQGSPAGTYDFTGQIYTVS